MLAEGVDSAFLQMCYSNLKSYTGTVALCASEDAHVSVFAQWLVAAVDERVPQHSSSYTVVLLHLGSGAPLFSPPRHQAIKLVLSQCLIFT